MNHHTPCTSPSTPCAHDLRPQPSQGMLFDGWLTTEQLARLLAVDPSSVRRWRTSEPPQEPPFVKLSGRITMYSKRDVEEWLLAHRTETWGAA